jgi:hypothetical protein
MKTWMASSAWSQLEEKKDDESASLFGGRVSRLNGSARLARIRTDFSNIKYLNKKDRLEFWNENAPTLRCQAFLEGKTNDYILVKIPHYDACIRKVHITTGSYLYFDSVDLKQNLSVGKELVGVLQKKRMALTAKKVRYQKELDGFIEKVDATNKRYEILRQKLEIEWQKELAHLEEDKSNAFTQFKDAEARLNEVDTKLEAYRIDDHNLKIDRWSIDPQLYYKK